MIFLDKKEKDDFFKRIFNLVSAIPKGRVLTYGSIAVLCGMPRHSRMVGKALGLAPNGTPCHRVVNHKGATAIGWPEQTSLLKKEGVSFKENGCVDLKKHLWR